MGITRWPCAEEETLAWQYTHSPLSRTSRLPLQQSRSPSWLHPTPSTPLEPSCRGRSLTLRVTAACSAVKNSPARQETQETQVRSLGQEDPLEEGMAPLSSTFAWRIPWTEESGGLQSIGSQRVRHHGSNLACTHFQTSASCISSEESPPCSRHLSLSIFSWGEGRRWKSFGLWNEMDEAEFRSHLKRGIHSPAVGLLGS